MVSRRAFLGSIAVGAAAAASGPVAVGTAIAAVTPRTVETLPALPPPVYPSQLREGGRGYPSVTEVVNSFGERLNWLTEWVGAHGDFAIREQPGPWDDRPEPNRSRYVTNEYVTKAYADGQTIPNGSIAASKIELAR